MRQIIVVLEDQKLSKILKKTLADKYKVEVLEKISASDAISFLEMLSHFELVVCNDSINRDFTYKRISKFIIESKDNLTVVPKMLVLTDNNIVDKNIEIIKRNSSLEFIAENIAFILGIIKERPVEPVVENNAEESSSDNEKTTVFQLPKKELLQATATPKVEVEKYFELDVRLLNFRSDFTVNCDLYTRVKKGENFEYNLKISKGTIVTPQDFEKIYNRGIKQLWIKDKEYALGSNQIVQHFAKILLDNKLTINERFYYNGQCYELLLKFVKENKIDQNFVEIIKNILPSFDFMVKNNEVFKLILNEYLEDKFSYGFIHSTLSCLLMHKIYSKFEWSKDLTLNKLNYLSFFHDLGMSSSRLIKMHHDYSFYKEKITEEEIAIVEKHADNIAKIIEKIVKAPKEIMALMREHHGVLNGIGMSENLNPRIYPLSKLFMITEVIVTHYLDFKEDHKEDSFKKETIIEILEKITSQFDRPGYSEIIAMYKKSVDEIFA